MSTRSILAALQGRQRAAAGRLAIDYVRGVRDVRIALSLRAWRDRLRFSPVLRFQHAGR